MVSNSVSIPYVLDETNFKFPGQKSFYKGKVRDVYTVGDLVVMIVTDRISAFDVVLPRAIPYKGQVLNQVAAYMLEATRDIVPNWLLEVPDPNVSLGLHCQPIRIEMVIRGFLSGHAWREYREGRREICGVKLPSGLKENDRLPEPIITPTTKAEAGHDQDISKVEIIRQELVDENEYEKLEEITHKLFQRGSELASRQGLMLVDTKYEFGKRANAIFLMDEVHTPDSSRYFYAEGYNERQTKGEAQKQLSKEFVRQWLIDNNFQGRKGESPPAMSDAWVMEISNRYIELYEKLTGRKFQPVDTENILQRVERNTLTALTRQQPS